MRLLHREPKESYMALCLMACPSAKPHHQWQLTPLLPPPGGFAPNTKHRGRGEKRQTHVTGPSPWLRKHLAVLLGDPDKCRPPAQLFELGSSHVGAGGSQAPEDIEDGSFHVPSVRHFHGSALRSPADRELAVAWNEFFSTQHLTLLKNLPLFSDCCPFLLGVQRFFSALYQSHAKYCEEEANASGKCPNND